MFFSFVSLFVLAFITPSEQVNVEILKPLRNGTEAALVIAPGAFIDGTAYKPLAQAIQNESPLRLWVVLLEGFIDNLINPPQLNTAFSQALSSLKSQGMKTNNVYLAGHSLGGTFVGMFGKQNHQMLKGILLYGSYLTRGNALSTFPVPVLTLGGDLDGLTRITRIQATFEEHKANVDKDKKYKLLTPVVTMVGVNHGQFASGIMPSEVKDYDLDPEVSNFTAYSAIAKYTSAFITVNSAQGSNFTLNATAVLEVGYENTLTIMTPLIEMKSLDINKENNAIWTGQAELFLAGLKDGECIKTKNSEISEQQLLTSKPKTDVNSDKINITTYTQVSLPFNPIDISKFYESPNQLQVILVDNERMKSVFPRGTYGNSSNTCKDMNQLAANYALSLASQTSRKRYTTRGQPIVVKDDSISHNLAIWLMQELQLSNDKKGLEVTGGRYTIPFDKTKPTETGLYYCKLLSPYRAMEWIYVDSLRKYVGP